MNNLRPDEQVTESEIRKSKTRNEQLKSGASTAASLSVGGLGYKAASKILPFLNEYIPEDLAMKGINKVMPSVGKFLKSGLGQGLSLKSGLDFLKNEFSKTEQNEPAKESKNIIEKESPELHQFISEEIKKGRKPIEAGAIAQNDKRFKDVINKLSRAHKTNWSSILESIYGSGDMTQPQQQMQQSNTQPQQQQGQQQGQLNPQIQAALQKIMQM